MIAKLVAKYFECYPQEVGEGGRGGRNVNSIRNLSGSGMGWGGEGQGIMNRENSMES